MLFYNCAYQKQYSRKYRNVELRRKLKYGERYFLLHHYDIDVEYF